MNTLREEPRRKTAGPRGLSLEEFARLADEVVDELPPRLCRDLSCGFAAPPEERREGGLLVLGEYARDLPGPRVVLYYGSFRALLGDAPPRAWERRLRKTLRHELRHHREALAGIHDLTQEGVETLAWLRAVLPRRARRPVRVRVLKTGMDEPGWPCVQPGSLFEKRWSAGRHWTRGRDDQHSFGGSLAASA